MSEQLIAKDLSERLPKDVDTAVAAIQYEIRRKRRTLENVAAKTETSENEKIKIGKEYEFIRNIERLIAVTRREFHANLGKIPPSDLDLEIAILGALMLESIDGIVKTAPINQVKSFLRPEHFYMDAHEKVYTVILEVHTAGQNPNMITVKNALRKKGWLEIVGGAKFLDMCTSMVSSTASVDYHARILVEFAIKRQLIFACAQILRNAYDDTQDAFDLLDTARDQINECYGWIKQ